MTNNETRSEKGAYAQRAVFSVRKCGIYRRLCQSECIIEVKSVLSGQNTARPKPNERSADALLCHISSKTRKMWGFFVNIPCRPSAEDSLSVRPLFRPGLTRPGPANSGPGPDSGWSVRCDVSAFRLCNAGGRFPGFYVNVFGGIGRCRFGAVPAKPGRPPRAGTGGSRSGGPRVLRGGGTETARRTGRR